MLFFIYCLLSYSVLLFAIIVYGMAYAKKSSVQKTPADILYISVSNLRGHQSLYRDGWFVASSTQKTFRYVKECAVSASGQTMASVIAYVQTRTIKYGAILVQVWKSSLQLSKVIYAGGTTLSKQALVLTKKLIKLEWRFAADIWQLAWQRFVTGNRTLSERTAEDRAAIAVIPANWQQCINNDFGRIRELARAMTKKLFQHVAGRWGDAFVEAKKSFNDAYENSGACGNAITGLGHILVGYGMALYFGVIKPAARSIVQVATVVVKGLLKLIMLPVALLVIVCGRTLQFSGLGLYYIAVIGVKLVSPTVEGVLLAGFSMLLYGTIPFTVVAGAVTAVITQVAAIVASPVAGVSKVVFVSVVGAAVYVALVSYSLLKTMTHVIWNQIQSVSVLAYNILTALPTQLLLAAANIFVFIVYDSLRLAVASVKGEVNWSSKAGNNASVAIQGLPVVNGDGVADQG
jgi:hypothetical protein